MNGDPSVLLHFESEDWGDWVAEGAAFEGGPFPVKSRSVEQKITDHTGERIANSYNTRLGGDHVAAHTRTGTLFSPEFTVERNSIRMTVGGGSRKGVYVAVIVDGKEVARVADKNSSTLYAASILPDGEFADLRWRAQGDRTGHLAGQTVRTVGLASARAFAQACQTSGSRFVPVQADAFVLLSPRQGGTEQNG